MKRLYTFKSRVGSFYIAEHGRRFHVWFEEQDLGDYPTVQQAIGNLTRGETFRIPEGVDTRELGIPTDLRTWEKLPE